MDQEGLSYLSTLAGWTGKGGFGIEKMAALASALGHPEEERPAIHVAGTNGKGSVSVGISAILGATGATVLLNTSPHLESVNERIVIDGLPISDAEFDAALLKVKEAANRADLDLSHFEGVTAAAFIVAAARKVDWAVYETGLGGRLDATNVLTSPTATVITTISFDHEAILGDTLAKIAGEKAGIIKANCPVFIGKLPDEARWVICERAREVGAPVVAMGEDFTVAQEGESWLFESPRFGHLSFTPVLAGAHQAENMALAIAVARYLDMEADACRRGLSALYWPARLERVRLQQHEFIIDSAHNLAGIDTLISFLDSNRLRGIPIIFGAVRTKRWQSMIERLSPYVTDWNLLTPHFPDAVPSTEIADYLSGIGLKAVAWDSNYRELLNKTSSLPGTTLIAGSMYMVGQLKKEMGLPRKPLWRRATGE